MSTNLFYNTITQQVLDYLSLKFLYPLISWPTNQAGGGVDDRISSSNPPNTFLVTYPDLGNWDRLERDYAPDPSSVKMWQIAELDAPVSHGASPWTQSYTVRERTAPEMIYINQVVANQAKIMRDSVMNTVINVGPLFTDTSPETRGAISDLIEYIQSVGDETTLSWKGPSDENGLPQWSSVTISDLQGLSVLVTEYQQRAFNAEKLTLEQQLDTPFDYMDDIDSFFISVYNDISS